MLDERKPTTSARPATPKVPKPTTGYIVANPDWNPAAHPAVGWMPHSTVKQAQEDLAFATQVGCRQMILKAQTTYTFVEDNSDG